MNNTRRTKRTATRDLPRPWACPGQLELPLVPEHPADPGAPNPHDDLPVLADYLRTDEESGR